MSENNCKFNKYDVKYYVIHHMQFIIKYNQYFTNICYVVIECKFIVVQVQLVCQYI